MKAIAFFDPRVNNGVYGKIEFKQIDTHHPVQIYFELYGFKAHSIHAIHIHEFGDLTDGCKSLGAHFNPTQRQHSHSEKGHAGDLFNNFKTNRLGQFVFTFETDKLSLFHNNRCILGRSVVIHKFIDDLGLQGILQDGNLVLYDEMPTEQLVQIYTTLGYPVSERMDREGLLKKLKSESITTGNASTRIACAIIGITKN